MKYAMLVGAAAAASSHHAAADNQLFDVGGLSDGVLLDFFDGFVDFKFSEDDRKRYDSCYEKVPALILDGYDLIMDIDWKHILNCKSDMQSFTEAWEFMMEFITDIPTQVSAFSVVVNEGTSVV